MKRLLSALMITVATALALSSGAGAATRPDYRPAQEVPTKTPIKHFISLMQENHSFDNYFGAYPGADGRPAGVCLPVDLTKPKGRCVKPFRIGERPIADLGHNTKIYAAQLNGGRMDGFVDAYKGQGPTGELAMGYYDESDLPFYYNVADNYVLFDRFFTSAAGGSVWNHFYWVTGSPGNPKSDLLETRGFDHVPTIFDRLDERGIDWKFYVQGYDRSVTFRNPGDGDRASQIVWVPLLNYNRYLDDPRLSSRIVPLEQYYSDLQKGTLPAVSFIAPAGASEHPPGSIRAGEYFLRSLLNALQASSAWSSSAFTWTYDDWGGWYDHVAPPKVDSFGYGFRAPALLVSPYAKKGVVDHTVLDFTSGLKFIEENWGVAPLAARDAKANSLASGFDFTSGPRGARVLPGDRVVSVAPPPKIASVFVGYGLATIAAVSFLIAGLRRTVGRSRNLRPRRDIELRPMKAES